MIKKLCRVKWQLAEDARRSNLNHCNPFRCERRWGILPTSIYFNNNYSINFYASWKLMGISSFRAQLRLQLVVCMSFIMIDAPITIYSKQFKVMCCSFFSARTWNICRKIYHNAWHLFSLNWLPHSAPTKRENTNETPIRRSMKTFEWNAKQTLLKFGRETIWFDCCCWSAPSDLRSRWSFCAHI